MAEVRDKSKIGTGADSGRRPAGKSVHRVSDSRSADGGSVRRVSDGRSAHRVPDGRSARRVPDGRSADGGSARRVPDGRSADGGSVRRVSDGRSADGGSVRRVPDGRSADGGSARRVPGSRSADGGSVRRVPDGKSSRTSDDKSSRASDDKSSRVSDGRSSRVSDGKSSRMSESRSSRMSESRSSRMSDSKSSRVSDGKSSRMSDGRSSRVPDGKSVHGRSANGSSSGRRPDGRSIKDGADTGRRKGRKKGNKRGHLLTNIILVVAVAVFCVSAYQLLKIWKGYHDGKSEYNKLKELAITEEAGDGDGQSVFQVNFDELKAINPDTVAWIRFSPEPAIISYPVVQGKDNEVYLHKTFSDNENTLGTIFLNVDNNLNFTDENTIIYGHRMKDGSMFGHLEYYKKKEFWEANPNFYIYTPDGRELVYQIFSVGEVLDTSETYLTEFPTNDDYQNFLNMTRQVAMYDTGVEVTTANTIVTLSTCTKANNDYRFVVRGVKISN